MILLDFARVSSFVFILFFFAPLVLAATTDSSASPLQFGSPQAAPDDAWGSCVGMSQVDGDKACAQIAQANGYVCTQTTKTLADAAGYDRWKCDPADGKYCNTGCATAGKFAGKCLCLYDALRGNPGCTDPTQSVFTSQTEATLGGKLYGIGQCALCGNLLFWPKGEAPVTPAQPETQEFVLAGVKRVYVDADNLESVDNLLTGSTLKCDAATLKCESGGFKVYVEFYDSGSWAVPSAVDSTRLLPPLRLSVEEVQFESNAATPGHDENFNGGYPTDTIYSQGYGYYNVKQGTMVHVKAIKQNDGPAVTDELWGWVISSSVIKPQVYSNAPLATGEAPFVDDRKVSNAFMGLTNLCSKAEADNGKISLKDSTFGSKLDLYAPVYVVATPASDEQDYLKPVLVHSLEKIGADGNAVAGWFADATDLCKNAGNNAYDPAQRGVAIDGRITGDYLVESYKEFPADVSGGKRVELTRTTDKDSGLYQLYDSATNIQHQLMVPYGFGAEFDWKRAKKYPTEFTSDNAVIKFNLYQIKSRSYCYLEDGGKTLEQISADSSITGKDKLAAIVAKGADAAGCPAGAYLEPVQNVEQKLDVGYYYQSGDQLKPLGTDKVLYCSGLECTEKPFGTGSTVPIKPVIVFQQKTGASSNLQPGVYALEATYPANQQAAPELATLSLDELWTRGTPAGLTEYIMKVGATYHAQDYVLRIDDVSAGSNGEQRILFRYSPASLDKTLDSLKEGDAGYEYAKYVPGKDYAVVGGIFQFKNAGDTDAATGPYASFAECYGNGGSKYCLLVIDRGTRAAQQPAGSVTTSEGCVITQNDAGLSITLPASVREKYAGKQITASIDFSGGEATTPGSEVIMPGTNIVNGLAVSDGAVAVAKSHYSAVPTPWSAQLTVIEAGAETGEDVCSFDSAQIAGLAAGSATCPVTYANGQAQLTLPEEARSLFESYTLGVCKIPSGGAEVCTPSKATNGELSVPSSALPQGSNGEVKTTEGEKVCGFATQSGATAQCAAAFDADGNLAVTAQNSPLDLSQESVGVKVSLFAATEAASVAELNFAAEPGKIIITKSSMDAAGAWTSGEIDVQNGEGAPFEKLCDFQPPSAAQPSGPCGAVIATTQCNELSVEGNQVAAQAGIKLEMVTGNTLDEVTTAVSQKIAEGGKAVALITTPSCPAAGQPTVVVTHTLQVAGETVAGTAVQDSFTAPAEGSAVEPGSQVQGADEAQTLTMPSAVKWFVRQLKGAYDVIVNALQNKGPTPLNEQVVLQTNVQIQQTQTPTSTPTQSPETPTPQQATPTPQQQAATSTPAQPTVEGPKQLTAQCSIATTSLATALDAAETQDPVMPTAVPEISQDGNDVTVSGLQAAVKALADNGHGSGVKAYLSYQDENGGKFLGKDSAGQWATAITADGKATWIGAKPMKDAPYSILVAGHNGKQQPLQSYAAVKAAEGVGQSSTAPQEVVPEGELFSIDPRSTCEFSLSLESPDTYTLDAKVNVKLANGKTLPKGVQFPFKYYMAYDIMPSKNIFEPSEVGTAAGSRVTGDVTADSPGRITVHSFLLPQGNQDMDIGGLTSFKLAFVGNGRLGDPTEVRIDCTFTGGAAEFKRFTDKLPALVKPYTAAYSPGGSETLSTLFRDMPGVSELKNCPTFQLVDHQGTPITNGLITNLCPTTTGQVVTLKFKGTAGINQFRTDMTSNNWRSFVYERGRVSTGTGEYGAAAQWNLPRPVFCIALDALTVSAFDIIMPESSVRRSGGTTDIVPITLKFDWVPHTYYVDANHDINVLKQSGMPYNIGAATVQNLCAVGTAPESPV